MSPHTSSVCSQNKMCSSLCRTTSASPASTTIAPLRLTRLAKSSSSSNFPANVVGTTARLLFDFVGDSVLVLCEWRITMLILNFCTLFGIVSLLSSCYRQRRSCHIHHLPWPTYQFCT
ncbi:hypothetical protein PILCRDRAFT_715986 [Piloderma croceum F 1598]|uniref:Uncharacterized protein n=1 Tax=Piloderma croceum (strain F 1598) TaxID=765440 RepID=A0A0C3EMT8_PILCF|nr:hypothetical protein PILCRDRAFT_715986 [Piloderma croceum F 1598]